MKGCPGQGCFLDLVSSCTEVSQKSELVDYSAEIHNVQARIAEHPNLREFSVSYNKLRLILDSAVKNKSAGV